MKKVDIKTVNEVNEFIASIIKELCKKHNVEKPIVVVVRGLPMMFSPFFGAGKIILNSIVYAFWEIDRESAERILRFVVAHEFKHYLQYLAGEIDFAITDAVYEAIKPKIEEAAIRFAEEYSKVSSAEVSTIFKRLFEVAAKTYSKRLPMMEVNVDV